MNSHKRHKRHKRPSATSAKLKWPCHLNGDVRGCGELGVGRDQHLGDSGGGPGPGSPLRAVREVRVERSRIASAPLPGRAALEVAGGRCRAASGSSTAPLHPPHAATATDVDAAAVAGVVPAPMAVVMAVGPTGASAGAGAGEASAELAGADATSPRLAPASRWATT